MVKYFEIGHISNTHGLKGEVKVRPFTESKNDFKNFKHVLIDFDGELKKYEIENVRYQNDVVLLKLKTIDTIEDAEKIKNHYIKISRDDAKKINDDEFFIADLIGCEVYENELLGVVEDVFTAGASDVYVVKRKGKKDLLLPAIASVIKTIDVINKRIDVNVPKGLDDED